MTRDDAPDPAPPLVVCVDDDGETLAGIERCLRRLPIQLRITTSASEALRWIVSDPVAVLVSDYEMPEMTGAELAGEARVARPETVRILLTGHQTLDTAVDGINRGEIFRFLTKPFVAHILRTEVAAALRRYAELAAIGAARDLAARRARLAAELDAEFPGITRVARDPDGTYVVRSDAWDHVGGLGLDPIREGRRRRQT